MWFAYYLNVNRSAQDKCLNYALIICYIIDRQTDKNMSNNFTTHSSWYLECIKCSRQVINASDLRLAEVGTDGGFHLALRPELEQKIDDIIIKRQHPKVERRAEAPFKMFCQNVGCTQDLGVYQILEGRFFYVFSSKSVRFRSKHGEMRKIRRWKESRADLERMGVQVLRVNIYILFPKHHEYCYNSKF